MADPIEKTETQSAQSAYDSVNDYNVKREQSINDLYDSQLNANKASIENAYNQNLSNMQADKEAIGNTYAEKNNSLGAQYERTRRNMNLQANANGLNTGAGSQLQLAQNSNYMSGKAELGKSEAEQLAEADRGITDLKTTYQNDIIQAQSNNDAQRAAALLDEYSNAYTRLEDSAKNLATYGDFSGYAALFGNETANNMRQMWIVQNPNDAYHVGAIDADAYFSITGTYPVGVSIPAATTYSGGGSGGGSWYDAYGWSRSGSGEYIADKLGYK